MSTVASAAEPQARSHSFRNRLLFAVGVPLLVLFAAVFVALRGLDSVADMSRASLESTMRSAAVTQSVLVATNKSQRAGERLLETRSQRDLELFERVGREADQIRRRAMRAASLSSAERSALAAIQSFERRIEVQTALVLLAQEMHRPADVARGLQGVAASADSAEVALAQYRAAGAADRVQRQGALSVRVGRIRLQIGLICLLAVLAAGTAVVGLFHRLAKSVVAENDLRVAKEAAEETSRLKSDFLAMMSHEIRTPMNGVLGMLGIALDSTLTSAQRSQLQIARSSAESLLVILNDILDYSKIEAGKLDIEQAPFDIAALIENVSELLAPRAHAKGLELVTHVLAEVPPRVVGDASRVRQVLINLVGNAIKFTDGGYIFLEVKLAGSTEETATLQFTVRDTGIGITEEQQSRLFVKFAQADASTTRRFGGTGLGLAISRQLTELMGGTIELKSAEGEGSTFAFTLRMPIDRSSAPPALENRSLVGLRVLIVDDIAVNRLVMSEQTIACGMRADEASGAEEAFALLRAAAASSRPVNAILVDYQMPGMDGLAFGTAVRAEPAWREIPMILLSSSMEKGDADRIAEAGFSGYFVKPVSASMLREALQAVIASGEGARSRLVTRESLQDRGSAVDGHGQPPSPWSATTRDGEGRQVLLVEDDAVNTLIAVTVLERAGWTVTCAVNGREGVERFSGGTFDVVLMDCQMPEMDGFDATRRIRVLEQERGTRATPVIAMTASAMLGDRERCIAAGMDDYLTKPIVDVDLVLAKLDEWRLPHRSEHG